MHYTLIIMDVVLLCPSSFISDSMITLDMKSKNIQIFFFFMCSSTCNLNQMHVNLFLAMLSLCMRVILSSWKKWNFIRPTVKGLYKAKKWQSYLCSRLPIPLLGFDSDHSLCASNSPRLTYKCAVSHDLSVPVWVTLVPKGSRRPAVRVCGEKSPTPRPLNYVHS